MITRFLGDVFSGRIFRSRQPKIVPFSAHGISRERISACALKVTDTLQDHDFTAFIVGGAVRDLILGWHPKDYDVATARRRKKCGRFSGVRASSAGASASCT